MTFNKPRLGQAIFSTSPFRPRTGILSPPEPTYLDSTDLHASNATADTHDSEPNLPEPSSDTTGPTTPTNRQADLIRLTDVEPRPIEWVWQDRLAVGTLAMLSGDPGSGKTWLALAIAAALSRGRLPLATETQEPCTVLYASTENGGAEVVRPRFEKLDGDPTRLVLLRGVLSDPSAPPTALSLRDTQSSKTPSREVTPACSSSIPSTLEVPGYIDCHRPADSPARRAIAPAPK